MLNHCNATIQPMVIALGKGVTPVEQDRAEADV